MRKNGVKNLVVKKYTQIVLNILMFKNAYKNVLKILVLKMKK